MVKIKVTDILLSPLVKTDYTVVIDDEEESLNNAILDILRDKQTEKEDLNTLVRKYNLSARRFKKGLSNAIFIYTHPAEGVVLRTVIEIYKQIAKEVSL